MRIILFLIACISQSVMAANPTKMVVVVNDEQKTQLLGVVEVSNYLNLKNAEFEIFSLDDVNTFENDFSEGLPADEEKAREMVQKKYDQIGQVRLQEMALKAYTAKILTLKYRLEKYPAIIFDDSAVIYGEFDLNKALNFYLETEE